MVKQQMAYFETIRFIKAVIVCICEKFQYCPIVFFWNLKIITLWLFQNRLSCLVTAYLLELIWWKNCFLKVVVGCVPQVVDRLYKS